MEECNRQRSELLSSVAELVRRGKTKQLQQLLRSALEVGAAPRELLEQGLLPGIAAVAQDYKDEKISVPQVLLCTRSMHMAMELLRPLLAEGDIPFRGRVCIGTIQGDLHDIGKNLVKIMMESQGLEVVDLGVDVPPEEFVRTAVEKKCDVICCSALLTTTMWTMEKVVQAAEAAGIRENVKIMLGGAPVTERFCRQIGADAYTLNAAQAADRALEFCRAKYGEEEQEKRNKL